MVGSRVEVLPDAGGDLFGSAPHHDRVDQTVRRPAAGSAVDVGLLETEAQQVVGVVGEPEVQGHVLAGQGACRGRIGVEYDHLLWVERRVGAHDLAGDGSVLGRHEVWMRSRGGLRRELEHLGTERGQHDLG